MELISHLGTEGKRGVLPKGQRAVHSNHHQTQTCHLRARSRQSQTFALLYFICLVAYVRLLSLNYFRFMDIYVYFRSILICFFYLFYFSLHFFKIKIVDDLCA